MNTKNIITIALISGMVSACAELPIKMGNEGSKTAATGSAGGANAQNANSQLESCSTPVGTMAVEEDDGAYWFRTMSQYGVRSTVPIIRLLAQQSNCFVVVERSRRGLKHIKREREFENSGELRNQSNFGKGQLVAADYTIIPSLVFSEKNSGGLGGALGGVLGSVGAAVGGSLKFSDAQSLFTLVDNRSGVQVAAAEGSARGSSIGGLLGLGGRKFSGAIGSYANTPESKVIVSAMMDAFNNLARATKNYAAQEVDSPGGLGSGGSLGVSGATNSNAGGSANSGGANAGGLTDQIRSAQVKLNRLGYSAGGADGVMGQKTLDAIRQFQTDQAMEVTGRLDKKTLEVLLQ